MSHDTALKVGQSEILSFLSVFLLSDASLAELPGPVLGGALDDAARETRQLQDGDQEHPPAPVQCLPSVVNRGL